MDWHDTTEHAGAYPYGDSVIGTQIPKYDIGSHLPATAFGVGFPAGLNLPATAFGVGFPSGLNLPATAFGVGFPSGMNFIDQDICPVREKQISTSVINEKRDSQQFQQANPLLQELNMGMTFTEMMLGVENHAYDMPAGSANMPADLMGAENETFMITGRYSNYGGHTEMASHISESALQHDEMLVGCDDNHHDWVVPSVEDEATHTTSTTTPAESVVIPVTQFQEALGLISQGNVDDDDDGGSEYEDSDDGGGFNERDIFAMPPEGDIGQTDNIGDAVSGNDVEEADIQGDDVELAANIGIDVEHRDDLEKDVEQLTQDDIQIFLENDSVAAAQSCSQEVRNRHAPQLNMVFDTSADCQKFYNDYACICGFAVRKASSYRGQKTQRWGRNALHYQVQQVWESC